MADVTSKRFDLSSGFTVRVQPLPPYYADFIEDQYPMADYPMRKITLASGDILDMEYTPPEEQPDVADTVEYELYVEWHSVNALNAEIKTKQERARRDFLLASCVSIMHGPFEVTDDAWVNMLEASFDNYKVPSHPGKRMVAFLKSCVIRTTGEYNQIMQAALFPEVTMQGITHALQGFQSDVGQSKPGRRHRSKGR